LVEIAAIIGAVLFDRKKIGKRNCLEGSLCGWQLGCDWSWSKREKSGPRSK